MLAINNLLPVALHNLLASKLRETYLQCGRINRAAPGVEEQFGPQAIVTAVRNVGKAMADCIHIIVIIAMVAIPVVLERPQAFRHLPGVLRGGRPCRNLAWLLRRPGPSRNQRRRK